MKKEPLHIYIYIYIQNKLFLMHLNVNYMTSETCQMVLDMGK